MADLNSELVAVTSSASGRVITLTLPGGRLSALAARALTDACLELRENESARVVVLRTADKDFCSSLEDGFDRTSIVPDPATALASLRVPVVGVIQGACFSGGLEIALCCDIRIGDSTTSFCMNEPSEGALPMWGGTQRLPRAISVSRATSMLMLGTEVDAVTAQSWNLMHILSEDPEEEVQKVINELLECGPLALEMAKEAVHRGSELPLRDGLRLEGDLNHQLAATDDRAEGLAAFFEKRPPDFSGR